MKQHSRIRSLCDSLVAAFVVVLVIVLTTHVMLWIFDQRQWGMIAFSILFLGLWATLYVINREWE